MNNITAGSINALSQMCHEANKRWWTDLSRQCQCCHGVGVIHQTLESPNGITCLDCFEGHPFIQRNVGELLMLIVSELAEAMESHRKDLMDDKLPHRKGLEVELADALIRIFDLAGGLKLDLGNALVEKAAYNKSRIDHSAAHRLADGGKKF